MQQQPMQQIFNARPGGSAAYSDFIKDIYTSTKTLSTMMSQLTARMEQLTDRINNIDKQLGNQNLGIQNIISQINDLAVQKTVANTQILSELDSLNNLDTLMSATSSLKITSPKNGLTPKTIKQVSGELNSNLTIPDINLDTILTAPVEGEQSEYESFTENDNNHVGEDITTQITREDKSISPSTNNFLILD